MAMKGLARGGEAKRGGNDDNRWCSVWRGYLGDHSGGGRVRFASESSGGKGEMKERHRDPGEYGIIQRGGVRL